MEYRRYVIEMIFQTKKLVQTKYLVIFVFILFLIL